MIKILLYTNKYTSFYSLKKKYPLEKVNVKF